MPDTKIHLEQDGIVDTLSQYILLYQDGADTKLLANTDIFGLGKAVLLIYDSFLKECATKSDQDLYEVCEFANLDFNTIRSLVNEVRSNG